MILYLEYHEHSQSALLLTHIKAVVRALRGTGLFPPHFVQKNPLPLGSGFSCLFITIALQLGILLLHNLFKILLPFQ